MTPLSDSNILIVEDNLRMSESIRLLLQMNGYDCAQTCLNLQDALNLIAKRSYDLLLLDLQLEDQSGFAVMDSLAERDINTNVIIVTGEHSEEYAITALRKGAVDYLKKPFEPDELLKSIKKALDRQRNQRKKNRLENVIVSSRERYRNAVDRQKDYLFILDMNCKIIFINKAYADHLGYPPKDVVGNLYKNYVLKYTIFTKKRVL